MNLANKLTMLRIFLVPIFLIFIAMKGIPYGTIIATLVFIIASLTDQLDGYIARSRNQVTTFGKFMDPLADKLLVTSALISLVELGLIPSYAAIIIIAREFAVSGLRTIAASEGKIIAASWWGKIKTVIQIISILLLLIKVNIETSPYLANLINNNSAMNKFFEFAPTIFLYLAVIVTIISGIDYFVKNKKVFSMTK
ncbi:CDP-diacylglycerol--glycerol-3-phosphate 3-phosphatidyltransferase [Clostridium sp. NSJ-49]|uniref:CDP-diacylglycerol--glycerol-3-phosphate 3-phosphatidyltransferase n=1 Tax=Clostridium TaxID=1485 RepID=UPI00164B9F87|nr:MULTISPECIES: CDP-diacylglycerol--glycerol-3-phosphate 3-phosphatidyltransferase [unclassified Clostridium]MBC5626817.1 CDP-diacylglycerol--glycerol-3-phosphate 3-phosphatidyltransferase [Clostridium sp. NSJ-49]MCD2500971.1 CDP-diacylglycerol--glycerol-3-phosphate 3-phosphatidyltransferase [Clostridium sp. NSJ-145]MDU6339706.1 CDP-diacylglycerol--glycerol-3-phosphate 3-phosphatidyltransferase [Clostridium sp.]